MTQNKVGEFSIERLAKRLKEAWDTARTSRTEKDPWGLGQLMASGEYTSLKNLAYIYGYGVDRDRIYIYLGDNTRKYVS